MNPLERILERYPDKPWDWDSISCNTNLQLEWIVKYPDEDWDWEEISENRFDGYNKK